MSEKKARYVTTVDGGRPVAYLPATKQPRPAGSRNGGVEVLPLLLRAIDVQPWAWREAISAESLKAHLRDRIALGREKYGEALRTRNGRDSLRDAYEEALDCALYLTQAAEEGQSPGGIDRALVREAVLLAAKLGIAIERRASESASRDV